MRAMVNSKESIKIRENLNRPFMRYVITPQVMDYYEKGYNYEQYDRRVLKFAKDNIGSDSDCFLLYAVSQMGCADLDTIRNFLSAMAKRNKNLSIASMDDRSRDYVRKRLSFLYSNGFLFRYAYLVESPTADKNGVKTDMDKHSLYTIDKMSQMFMAEHFSKRIAVRDWLVAKNIGELVSMGSASYAGAKIANSSRFFVEYKKGVFKSRSIGTCYLSLEIKFDKEGESYYVGVVPAYMHYYDKIQSPEDFEDACIYKLNLIKNYFEFRDYRNETSRMVVSVENNGDLMEFSRFVQRYYDVISPYLDRIYITGEGAIKGAASIKEAFLRMVPDGSGAIGFEDICPEFF